MMKVQELYVEAMKIRQSAQKSLEEEYNKKEEALRELGKEKLRLCVGELDYFLELYLSLAEVDISDIWGKAEEIQFYSEINELMELVHHGREDIKSESLNMSRMWGLHGDCKVNLDEKNFSISRRNYVMDTSSPLLNHTLSVPFVPYVPVLGILAAKKQEKEAEENLKAAKEMRDMADEEIKEIRRVTLYINKLCDKIRSSGKVLADKNNEMKNILRRHVVWNEFTVPEKKEVVDTVKFVLELKDMIQKSLVNE